MRDSGRLKCQQSSLLRSGVHLPPPRFLGMWDLECQIHSNGIHLNFKSSINALEELMLVLAGCPESKVVEVSSINTIGAQQGPPGAPTHRTSTPPVVAHVPTRALLCMSHSCKTLLLRASGLITY